VPGPGRVLFQGAFANFNPHSPAAVDFKNSSRAPLLFIAGGDDHVAPASLNEANVKHYRKSDAITEIKEYESKGVRFVGPLPADVQNYTSYEAVMTTGATSPASVKIVLKQIATPAGKSAFTSNGVE